MRTGVLHLAPALAAIEQSSIAANGAAIAARRAISNPFGRVPQLHV